MDLTPRVAEVGAPTPITPEDGNRIAQLMGCSACHSVDGSTLGKVGRVGKVSSSGCASLRWTSVAADENYLRESLR